MGPYYDTAYIRHLEERADAGRLTDLDRARRHSLRQRSEGMLLIFAALVFGLAALAGTDQTTGVEDAGISISATQS